MVESMVCWGCKQEFVPDNEYVFPNYCVYWHECTPGVFTQIVVVKEKKCFWKEKETSKDKNFNRLLMSYYNPLLRKIHDVDNENNYNEREHYV